MIWLLILMMLLWGQTTFLKHEIIRDAACTIMDPIGTINLLSSWNDIILHNNILRNKNVFYSGKWTVLYLVVMWQYVANDVQIILSIYRLLTKTQTCKVSLPYKIQRQTNIIYIYRYLYHHWWYVTEPFKKLLHCHFRRWTVRR